MSTQQKAVQLVALILGTVARYSIMQDVDVNHFILEYLGHWTSLYKLQQTLPAPTWLSLCRIIASAEYTTKKTGTWSGMVW